MLQFVLSWHNGKILVGAVEMQKYFDRSVDVWSKYFISKGYRKYFDGASLTRSGRYNNKARFIDTFSLALSLTGHSWDFISSRYTVVDRVSKPAAGKFGHLTNVLFFVWRSFDLRLNRIRVVWLGANFSACTWVAGGTGPPGENESKPRWVQTPHGDLKPLFRVLSLSRVNREWT